MTVNSQMFLLDSSSGRADWAKTTRAESNPLTRMRLSMGALVSDTPRMRVDRMEESTDAVSHERSIFVTAIPKVSLVAALFFSSQLVFYLFGLPQLVHPYLALFLSIFGAGLFLTGRQASE